MYLPRNQLNLLALVFLLLFFKFAWVPVIEWQSAYWSDFLLLNKKLNKMKTLNENKERVQNQSIMYKDALEKVESILPESGSIDQFKLAKQEDIQMLAENNSLRILGYNWADEGLDPQSSIYRETLEIRFNGEFSDVLQFHFEIESKKQMLRVLHFNFNFPKAKVGMPGFIQGTMRIQFFAAKE